MRTRARSAGAAGRSGGVGQRSSMYSRMMVESKTRVSPSTSAGTSRRGLAAANASSRPLMKWGSRVRPFVAREGDEIVARVAAVVDSRYNRHWRERLGHLVMFEALPGTREATRLLLDAACEWLEREGTEAARAGFGVLEFPFVIDAYDVLPPPFVRHNPAYYHSLLKDAGFETERGL